MSASAGAIPPGMDPRTIMPAPPGYVQNVDHPPEDVGYRLYVTTYIILPITTIFFIIRLYTRFHLTRNPGWDDLLLAAAYICCVGICALTILAGKYGVGVHIWNVTLVNLTHYLKCNVAYGVLYACSANFSRLSIATLYFRLNGGRAFRIACIVYLVTNTILLIIAVTTSLLVCDPFKKQWDILMKGGHCYNFTAWALYSGAIHIILDVWLIILPLTVIWRLPFMTQRMKLALTSVFGLGIITLAFSIARLVVLKPMLNNPDVTWTRVWPSVLSSVELHASVVCACMMTFRPFLRRFFPKMLDPHNTINTPGGGVITPGDGVTKESDAKYGKSFAGSTMLGTTDRDERKKSEASAWAGLSTATGKEGSDAGEEKEESPERV